MSAILRKFYLPSRLIGITLMVAALACPTLSSAQQKELPELTIATAVNNMAFSAVWVAEQLKFFDQERVLWTNKSVGKP